MPTAVISRRSSVLGKVAYHSETVTGDGGVIKDPTLAAAKAGTLSLRTSNTVGTLTMESGHGITTAARLDLYFANGRRYGITVGTVSGLSVPFTLGDGDNLPAQGTAILAMVPQLETFEMADVTTLLALICACLSAATLVFRNGAGADLKVVQLAGPDTTDVANAGTPDGYEWSTSSGADNPLGAADVAEVYMSHNGTVAREVSAIALA